MSLTPDNSAMLHRTYTSVVFVDVDGHNPLTIIGPRTWSTDPVPNQMRMRGMEKAYSPQDPQEWRESECRKMATHPRFWELVLLLTPLTNVDREKFYSTFDSVVSEKCTCVWDTALRMVCAKWTIKDWEDYGRMRSCINADVWDNKEATEWFCAHYLMRRVSSVEGGKEALQAAIFLWIPCQTAYTVISNLFGVRLEHPTGIPMHVACARRYFELMDATELLKFFWNAHKVSITGDFRLLWKNNDAMLPERLPSLTPNVSGTLNRIVTEIANTKELNDYFSELGGKWAKTTDGGSKERLVSAMLPGIQQAWKQMLYLVTRLMHTQRCESESWTTFLERTFEGFLDRDKVVEYRWKVLTLMGLLRPMSLWRWESLIEIGGFGQLVNLRVKGAQPSMVYFMIDPENPQTLIPDVHSSNLGAKVQSNSMDSED